MSSTASLSRAVELIHRSLVRPARARSSRHRFQAKAGLVWPNRGSCLSVAVRNSGVDWMSCLRDEIGREKEVWERVRSSGATGWGVFSASRVEPVGRLRNRYRTPLLPVTSSLNLCLIPQRPQNNTAHSTTLDLVYITAQNTPSQSPPSRGMAPQMPNKTSDIKKIIATLIARLRGSRRRNETQLSTMKIAEKEAALDTDSDVSSEAASSLNSRYYDARFEACRILAEAAVPLSIWGEDAVAAHGVPTVLFDLFLLVDNVPKATALLQSHGFVLKPREDQSASIPEFEQRWGIAGDLNQDSDLVLLCATEWSYDLIDTTSTWIPPMDKLLDSLMWKWTGDCSLGLLMRLAVYISYSYLYVEGVKRNEYAACLRKENRQLHYDLVDETATADLATERCQEHYRAVRDRIRSGTLDPTGPSGVQLFPPMKGKHKRYPLLSTEIAEET